ncbi:AAA family ATPase [Noviherbaspirillum pedocola]|uniref:AAA family ATPase n=1 Tax=Noviherbaspirillum pedocola TaxID=2801341 RepID=A0A934STS1_9BURK|nr:AAA family ATPase [Noviherbaspirillum pedocola]MBK4735532.1 AAA family ATPase [Noviherbaspirillum pedocola]
MPAEVVRKLEQQRLEAQARVEAAQRLAEEQESATKGKGAWEPAVEEWPTDVVASGEPFLKLLDKRQVEEAVDSFDALFSESDRRQRARALVANLRDAGEYRSLLRLPPDWRRVLRRLERRFPNFTEVVNYLRSMLALAEHGDGTIRFSPVLLAGPPGVGKSLFCEAFAGSFKLYLVCMRMENAQSNAGLAGSEEFWSNTQPGRLFDALVHKTHANPLFFLDEIDKVSTEGRYDPMSSLLSLLEPGTASSFQDLSFPWLNLDASRVLYICTANDAGLLSEPIRSRLKVFDVPQLTPAQSQRMAVRIFTEVRREVFGARRSMKLDRAAFDAVASLTPREMRRVIRQSIGWALFNSRRTVLAGDVGMAMNVPKGTMGFGFVRSP